MICDHQLLSLVLESYIVCRVLCFSLIPSLYSTLKSEGHSFVSDEVVSFVRETFVGLNGQGIVGLRRYPL